MGNIKKKIVVGIATVLIGLAGWLIGGVAAPKLGSAPSGLATTIASSSQAVLSNAATLPTPAIALFQPFVDCTSRIITTTAQPIMLSFGTRYQTGTATTTVSGTRGHLQAASTTVAYDAGLYGCGFVGAVSADATTTITVTEFK